jgi:hypothetical protein
MELKQLIKLTVKARYIHVVSVLALVGTEAFDFRTLNTRGNERTTKKSVILSITGLLLDLLIVTCPKTITHVFL